MLTQRRIFRYIILCLYDQSLLWPLHWLTLTPNPMTFAFASALPVPWPAAAVSQATCYSNTYSRGSNSKDDWCFLPETRAPLATVYFWNRGRGYTSHSQGAARICRSLCLEVSCHRLTGTARSFSVCRHHRTTWSTEMPEKNIQSTLDISKLWGTFFTSSNYPKCTLICTSGNLDL